MKKLTSILAVSLSCLALGAADIVFQEKCDTVPANAKGITLTEGVYGKAWKMDGTGGLTVDKSLDLADGFTIAMWVKPAGVRNYQSLFYYGYSLYWRLQGKSSCFNFNGWHTLEVPDTFSANEWIHVATTFDGTTMITYADGKKVGEAKPANTKITNKDSISLFFRPEEKQESRFTGEADEIVVYNGALTPEEVAKLAAVPAEKN